MTERRVYSQGLCGRSCGTPVEGIGYSLLFATVYLKMAKK